MSQYEFSEPVNNAVASSSVTATTTANSSSNSISTIKTVSTSLVYVASLAYLIFSEQNILV